ncbi:NADH-dependent [FeFe] hydrogenase, group A6 [Spirochaeta dissipatitropha]
MYNLTIDGIEVSVEPGATILDASKKAGVVIPTLCNMETHQPLGACRVCMVEVEGAKSLLAACAAPVVDGMKVKTTTRRVRTARTMVVDLLLSEHNGECGTCFRNGECELQSIAAGLGLDRDTITGPKLPSYTDNSTSAIVRYTGKCIKCRRCVRVCHGIQGVGALYPQGRGFGTTIGPAFGGDLSTVACVQCGQCAAVCPVGAIMESSHIDRVWDALDNPDLHVVVQTAPAIRAAIGECFGLPPGTRVTGKMVQALRRLGFDAVFDTNFTADLTIMEEGTELLQRLQQFLAEGKDVPLPLITSCSPGWINFAEQNFPQILPMISSCKSPQQMFGTLAKTYYASEKGIDPEKIYVVSIMPCTAKKYESERPEMRSSGYQDVDAVLTTRELAHMIQQAGISFTRLQDSRMDDPLGISSGAADIFGNSGGVMEAALRTVHELVTGEALPGPEGRLEFHPVRGLEGIKEARLKLGKVLPEWKFLEDAELSIAVASGLGNAAELLRRIESGEQTYHFVEIMCCPGGCIGGGGQPRPVSDELRLARIAGLYAEDAGRSFRSSHQNPAIQTLYRDFLGSPGSDMAHHLLHTHYHPQ